MKTLHLYLTRQILLSLLLTVAVFTFVLLLGNVLKEILALLVSRQITLGLVIQAIGLLIPFVMAYVLPFAMLTAVLLTFGRFSADQELTAVRAGGVSLVALVTPILILSLLLSGLCALFNLWIAPKCRDAYKNLIYQLERQDISRLITENRFITEIPGIVLYVRERDGDRLQDVRFYTMENGQIVSRTYAPEGEIIWDSSGRALSFQLEKPITESRIEPDPDFEARYIGPPAPSPRVDWRPIIISGFLTIGPIDLTELFTGEREPKLSEMSFGSLLAERRRLEALGISSMPVRVQLHRQVAFSFACFAFTLVGIPLAIRAHRRETSIGVAIALGLVLVYYAFFILGDALETREQLRPHLILWIPNFLFQVLGSILLLRANSRA